MLKLLCPNVTSRRTFLCVQVINFIYIHQKNTRKAALTSNKARKIQHRKIVQGASRMCNRQRRYQRQTATSLSAIQ